MIKISLTRLIVLVFFFLVQGWVSAQTEISASGQNIKIGKDGSLKLRTDGTLISSGHGNNASVNVGNISDNADIEGVTVINGRVSIDGKDVSPGITRYKSPKSGKVYLIQRKDGSVSVSEAGGAE